MQNEKNAKAALFLYNEQITVTMGCQAVKMTKKLQKVVHMTPLLYSKSF